MLTTDLSLEPKLRMSAAVPPLPQYASIPPGWWRTNVSNYATTVSCNIVSNYLTSPCSRVLLEKLTGPHLLKKFPTFYGNRRFITAFTRTCRLSLSWARSIQSMSPSNFSNINFNTIIPSLSRYSKWFSSLRLPRQKSCIHFNPSSSVLHVCSSRYWWGGGTLKINYKYIIYYSY